MEKEELQDVAFNLITKVGEARSKIFQAMGDLADKKITQDNFDEMMLEAQDLMSEAGQTHLSVIQSEASGIDIQHTILLTHAEDLYLTTSTMLEMILKLIKLFELKN